MGTLGSLKQLLLGLILLCLMERLFPKTCIYLKIRDSLLSVKARERSPLSGCPANSCALVSVPVISGV